MSIPTCKLPVAMTVFLFWCSFKKQLMASIPQLSKQLGPTWLQEVCGALLGASGIVRFCLHHRTPTFTQTQQYTPYNLESTCDHTLVSHEVTSLIPRPPRFQFLIAYSIHKQRGTAWKISSHE